MKASDRLSADSKAELEAVNRMLKRANGFVLGFVSINHQALREALIEEYVSASGGKILVATLDAAAGESIVHQIGRCLDSYKADRPLAIFVRGLEDMLELPGTRLQYIEDLNSRGCGERFPFPLIFWAPDYVIREFSYRVEGDVDDIRETVSGMQARVHELLNSPERAGEVRALSSLLHALRGELPQAGDQRSLGREDECDELRAEIEEQLADLAGYAGKMDKRARHLLRAFDITKMRKDLKASAHMGQKLGQITLQMGRYRDAENYYKQAFRWYLDIDEKRGQSECYHGLGLVNLMLASYEDAEWLFSAGCSTAEEDGYAKGQADGYLCLGHASRSLGHNELAGDFYRQAMEIYSEISDETGRGNCLEGLADLAWVSSDYNQAKTLYSEALDLAQDTFHKRGEAGCKEGLGHVAFMLADFDKANDLYDEALRLYRTIWHRRGEANALRAIGEVKRVRNEEDKAKEYFEEALSIYQKIGHRRGEADAIRELGHIARVRDEYRGEAAEDEFAADQYNKALAIYEDIGSRWGQAACAEGLGDISLTSERYSDAGRRYQRAVELSRAIGNRKGEAVALRGLGDAAWGLGDYNAAARHYESAQKIASHIGDGPGEAAFIRDRGDAAWAKKQYDLAEQLYREALVRSTGCGDRWGEADGNQKLGNIAWKAGDVGKAAHLYCTARDKYHQLGAGRLEAECLVVLGRLPVASAGREFMHRDNPAEDRKANTESAIRILKSIKATSRVKEVESDATLEQLIQGLYARHLRPELRRL